MNAAVKCSFLLISNCKLKMKVKLEDNQLCADCLPCIRFSFDISVGFQAVVTLDISYIIVETEHVFSLQEAFEDLHNI